MFFDIFKRQSPESTRKQLVETYISSAYEQLHEARSKRQDAEIRMLRLHSDLEYYTAIEPMLVRRIERLKNEI